MSPTDVPRPPHATALGRRRFLGGAAGVALGTALSGGLTAVPASASPLGGTDSPVRTESGLVTGTAAALDGVTVYKGIPYAASTAGANRWRPPQPAETWSGVRAADTFGNSCPQGGQVGPTMSEDCLNLNVWTAAESSYDRRPVFVWIYGGRFIGGSGSNAQFDGAGLARKGLVVVTLNYRTASYGFLSTPELTEESAHGSSGNYGLLDQLAALKWVRRNIAAFGGDPDNVTIGGQSAGAASVLSHVSSPLSKGLFHRAILESGAFYPKDPQIGVLATSYRTRARAEELGSAWMTRVGASTLDDARNLPTATLLTGIGDNDSDVPANSNLGGPNPPVWRPVLDGWMLPRTYWDALRTGRHNDVPVINGNNKNENGAMPNLSKTAAQFTTWAEAAYAPLADDFRALYPVTADTEGGPQAIASIQDRDRLSAHDWAALWARHAKSPVYTYYWTHAVPGQSQGAYHGSEISYVFNNLYATNTPWTSDDHAIADTLSDYVVNFATAGDPNDEDLTRWYPTDARSQTVMQLGDGWGPIATADPDKADFFRRFFSLQPAW